jgi:hypothetical protein
MDATVDYEAPDVFYRAKEGGETWYHGRETVDGEWSYSMLLFQGEERKGSAYFRRGKEHGRRLLLPKQRGNQRMQQCNGVRRWSVAGVRWCLDLPEVEDKQSGHLGQKAVWAEYCCVDQTGCQNRMDWEREIVGLKENCEEEFGCCCLNKNLLN